MSLEIFTITGSRVLIAIMNRVTRKVEKLALDFFQETRKLLAPLKKLDGTGGDKNEMLLCLHPASFLVNVAGVEASVVTQLPLMML